MQDEQETTYGIFKKLKFLKYYQMLFFSIVVCFTIPLGVKDYKNIRFMETNYNRNVQEWSLKTIILTRVFDLTIICLALSFLAGLLL